MRAPWYCLGLFLIGIAAPLGARDDVAVNVWPRVAMSPANVHVRAVIEPNSANRGLVLEAESNDSYRSTEVELDGASAPRMKSIEFRGLPVGEYVVTATLLGAGHETRAVARQRVSVQ